MIPSENWQEINNKLCQVFIIICQHLTKTKIKHISQLQDIHWNIIPVYKYFYLINFIPRYINNFQLNICDLHMYYTVKACCSKSSFLKLSINLQEKYIYKRRDRDRFWQARQRGYNGSENVNRLISNVGSIRLRLACTQLKRNSSPRYPLPSPSKRLTSVIITLSA